MFLAFASHVLKEKHFFAQFHEHSFHLQVDSMINVEQTIGTKYLMYCGVLYKVLHEKGA